MKKSVSREDGGAISYNEFGDETGFPILINHGLIASIEDSNLFERLVRLKAHLICVARPGYGESSPYMLRNIGAWAELMEILVDHLHLIQFDVLGMSSGAPYSYALGYRFRDRVRNIYIFSGIPALYDEQVQSQWPFEIKKDASIAEMQAVARELFFSNLSKELLERNDVNDSMKNSCFGVAQDLKIRCADWGFRLSDIRQTIYMQHSKTDKAVPFLTAQMTANLLPHCQLSIRENGEHFSSEALDDFIESVIVENFRSNAAEHMA